MKKELNLFGLIAIAIGGMVGGGIFTVLGVSVKMIGFLAPFAIFAGGILAFFAAYSYVKLGVYYKDEGATYAFFKRTFSNSHLASAFIGWFTIFGYISTLALYAYTFSSYAICGFSFLNNIIMRKIIAISIIWFFAFINLKSVKDMSEAEDVMVYVKLAILFTISFALIYVSRFSFFEFSHNVIVDYKHSNIFNILTVSSVTFVAYEGFQLVINGVNDMENPERNIPSSIYIALTIVSTIYFFIALGAVLAVDTTVLSKYQEYALSYGAKKALGNYAQFLVIAGAVLATSSAINSTLYGSSHQMARIADDGYLPTILSKRKGTIPTNAMLAMSFIASLLIIIGGLKLILEFGSITFLIVSTLMAYANFTIRDKTNSNVLISSVSIFGLSMSITFILYYELRTNTKSLEFILAMYGVLSLFAYLYSKFNKNRS